MHQQANGTSSASTNSLTQQSQAADQAHTQSRAPADQTTDVLKFPEYATPSADDSKHQLRLALQQRWQREIELACTASDNPHVIDISAFKALDSDGCSSLLLNSFV
jgi:hypothetical protein